MLLKGGAMCLYIISFLLVGSIVFPNNQSYSQMPEFYRDGKSFNWSLKQLPPNFKEAEDIASVYDKYYHIDLERSAIIQKDEFETTKQYKERLKSGIKPLTMIHAFTCYIEKKYDADMQVFKLGISLGGRSAFTRLTGRRTIVIGYYQVNRRPWAYGISFAFDHDAIQFVLKVPIKSAKFIKNDLNGLILCRPIKTELGGMDARYSYSYLVVNLLEVWIYNEKSGQILHKKRILG
jgi:hypothetical protein